MIGVEDGVLWDLQAKKAIIINWVLREIQVKETKEYLGEKIYERLVNHSRKWGIS